MKHHINAVLYFFASLCCLATRLPAQPLQWKWQPVAPGIWKATLGEPQPIDLLRAAGGPPRMEALKGLGERPFPPSME
ncbi:MAG: hypothetical protein ABUL46_01695, partial [Chitinophaga rupis]